MFEFAEVFKYWLIIRKHPLKIKVNKQRKNLIWKKKQQENMQLVKPQKLSDLQLSLVLGGEILEQGWALPSPQCPFGNLLLRLCFPGAVQQPGHFVCVLQSPGK